MHTLWRQTCTINGIRFTQNELFISDWLTLSASRSIGIACMNALPVHTCSTHTHTQTH